MSKSISSGILSADKTIIAGVGQITGVLINTFAAGASSLVVYDNASATSGLELFTFTFNDAGTHYFNLVNLDLRCDFGLTCDFVTDNQGTYIIYYA